jgi:hypothetical protein
MLSLHDSANDATFYSKSFNTIYRSFSYGGNMKLNTKIAIAIVAITASGFAAGCSSSSLPNGTVICGHGDNPCPDGYTCFQPQNTCWKNGTGPDGGDPTKADTLKLDDGGGAYFETGSQADGVRDVVALPETSLADSTGKQDVIGQDDTAVGKDGKVGEDGEDAPLGPDSADSATTTPDAPKIPDAPIVNPETGGCPTNKVSCNGVCIDPPPVGCCAASECTGPCKTCGADHTCTALKNADDPSGNCTGTCDSTGTCKAKKGQSCSAVASGCISGTTCADGYCCDKACSGACEACDISGTLGTCTPLPSGSSPHSGHPTCTGADATCNGQCNGTSNTCTYPTTECGTASCTGTSYQGKGNCSQGSCVKPGPETCPNVCSVSQGGCTGSCSPSAKQCSTTGVPQLCSSAGAWQNQTACGSGFTCSGGDCKCNSPKTTCGDTCTDTQTDNKNCGQCGHDCLGSACTAGKCQPIEVASNIPVPPVGAMGIFGVGDTYLYYDVFASASYFAYRVNKNSTQASGTLIYDGGDGSGIFPIGVSGNTMVFNDSGAYTCSVSTATSCTSSAAYVADQLYGIVRWVNSPPQNFAVEDASEHHIIQWYSMSGNHVATFDDYEAGAFHPWSLAVGNSVYFVRELNSVYSLFSTNSSSSSTKVKLTDSLTANMVLSDANDKSILLWDTSSSGSKLYRVPVTGGNPQQITTSAASPPTRAVTEDASYVYWFDGDGTINRCSPSSCSTTTISLASGQSVASSSQLYYDSLALYWADASRKAIMKLAK